MSPDVGVESVPENMRESNVEEIVPGVDCVVDGLDNMRTRYLLNRACVKHKIPYIFGAAIGIEEISPFAPHLKPLAWSAYCRILMIDICQPAIYAGCWALQPESSEQCKPSKP